MKLTFCLTCALILMTLSFRVARAKEYKYESVPNDPLNARIYKLDNGLTVYLSVYKDEPRVQTYIPVKAGSKNDPADATGLAHYLEHMLFKGTNRFGSLDFAKEEIEINRVTDLFEQYRATTDTLTRRELYRQIDSTSQVASQHAIPGEYDKMMSALGAKGTNAYTWVEQTVYVNDIPSNQLEKWLTVEAERYRQPVLRLFHTELEAVYEEKNISLDDDNDKIYETLFANLFPTHQYGTQTTIGTIEHLKNPSMKKVMDYYNTYYVPNNMAICLSGDFDPDQVIRLIDEKFGALPRKDVPKFVPAQEKPITAPIVKNVVGPDAESVTIGFRLRGEGSPDADLLKITDMILTNSTAGLIDLNLNQSQKVIEAYSSPLVFKDYSMLMLGGRPREGQKLEEITRLLLEQLDKLKQGDFPDWLPAAAVNDMKIKQLQSFEKNRHRAGEFVSAFVTDVPWDFHIHTLDRLSKITKKDIIAFANEVFKDNYVVVYKRTGESPPTAKVTKPPITPAQLNREAQSEFVTKVLAAPAPEILPVFLDYHKDLQTLTLHGQTPLYYVKNEENALFSLFLLWDMGTNHDRRIAPALSLLEYLGTSKYSPAELKQEFYKIGCTFSVIPGEEQIQIKLSGLTENFAAGMKLLEELLQDAQPNDAALVNLIQDVLKHRANAKLDKQEILWGALYAYGEYGLQSPYRNILTEAELKALKSDDLIALVKSLTGLEHRFLYYGPLEAKALTVALEKAHPKKPLKAVPLPIKFEQISAAKTTVYVVNYDMEQAEILMLSKSELFNPANAPVRSLFREYYGGGMSSVVFQTMRESKALAYSVFGGYSTPTLKDKAHYVLAYIGTQADKLPEAMAGMMDLMNNMPEADNALAASKTAVLKKTQTERINQAEILFSYEAARKLGLDRDLRKDVYDHTADLTMADVKTFHERYLKNKPFNILVLGNKEKLDLKALGQYGEIKELELTDVFGY